MTGSQLKVLYFPNYHLLELKTLNLENNSITIVDEESFKALLQSNISIKLSGNNMKHIPSFVSKVSLKANLWLAENPFECNCDMMWMRDWLQNASHVMDKEKIKCGAGRFKGEKMSASKRAST